PNSVDSWTDRRWIHTAASWISVSSATAHGSSGSRECASLRRFSARAHQGLGLLGPQAFGSLEKALKQSQEQCVLLRSQIGLESTLAFAPHRLHSRDQRGAGSGQPPDTTVGALGRRDLLDPAAFPKTVQHPAGKALVHRGKFNEFNRGQTAMASEC